MTVTDELLQNAETYAASFHALPVIFASPPSAPERASSTGRLSSSLMEGVLIP